MQGKEHLLSTTVSAEDFIFLEEGQRLSDKILNGYLGLLERCANGDGQTKVLSLDTFYLPSLKRGRKLADRRFLRRNPFEYDLILVPVHMETREHWALIAVWPKSKRMQSFDSLHWPHKMDLYPVFYSLKREAARRNLDMAPEAWHLQDTLRSTPRQTNTYDCGVYVLWFADRLARGEEIVEVQPPFDPVAWRDHIRNSLSQGKILVEEALLAEKGLPPLPDTADTDVVPDHLPVVQPDIPDLTSSGVTMISPYTSWESLLQSLSPEEVCSLKAEEIGTSSNTDSIGIADVSSIVNSPGIVPPASPCLSCIADDSWLEKELQEAMEETAPLTGGDSEKNLATDIVDKMEVEPANASGSMIHESIPTEEAQMAETRPEQETSNHKPKRKAKRKKVVIHFPWGPKKIDYRFVRPDCF